jgi:nucleoside-diphosphate-sugar epimerase
VKRALVTGAAGFVGRHMTAALESAGWYVEGWDIRRGAGWQGDVRGLFRGRDSGHDLVVHAAAHVGGRADIEGRPTFLGAYNLQLDGALFEWALRAGPGRVVYLSSSAAYPVELQTGVPPRALFESDVDLSAPRLPDATYGWTKLTGERLAAEAAGEGLRVHVVRPFSGYGEDQSDDYPFPAILGRVARREDPVVVWGDGGQVRDWIHIDDVCAGILVMVEQDVSGPVNLCTGRAVSMRRLAELAGSEAGYPLGTGELGDGPPDPSRLPPRVQPIGGPAGVRHRVGDSTAMRRFFEPKVELEEGIRRALAG